MSNEKEHAFAVVESIETDGLRLKFDGEDVAGDKTYKCNTFFVFSPGDRVYCVRDSGTYVAICKIGAPATELSVAKATTADSAKTADSATKATTADSATKATTADSATNATTAAKVKAVQYSSETYAVQFRWNSKGYVEFKHDRMDEWMPLLAPIDETRSIFNLSPSEKVIRFRSTSAGKLEYLVPYLSTTTWHTITST